MSGGNPLSYLETLKKFGLGLSPRAVVCMLYEGNDFRGSNFSHKKTNTRWSLRILYRTSPLRLSIKNALIRCLGPINNNQAENPSNIKRIFTPSNPLYAVSWLPLTIPQVPDARYYTFKVKRLSAHFTDEDDFLNSTGCGATLNTLNQIKQICDENNIRFIIAYAPDKPHVLLPLAKDNVSAEKVRAFMALRKKNLPPAKELIDTLLSRLEVQESAIQEFCRRNSIGFVDLTEPLRRQILRSRQVYFTYDQHWTPIGHEVAADTLHHYIENNPKEK